MRDPSASFLTRLGRGLRRRCPRCGSPDAFSTYYDLHSRCPGCGLAFEREPGYWVGAMIVVTTITFAVFLAVLVGGVLVTLPDPPWTGLLVATIAVNLVVPVVGYPQCKLIWSAMELGWHPLEPDEIEAARQFATAPSTSASPPRPT